MDSTAPRRRRQALVAALSREQGGVLLRRQLYELGITRSEVRAEIAAGRWFRAGQCVRVAPPTSGTPWWNAVLNAGPAAVIDGLSALLVAGLRTVHPDAIHVAVPPGAWFRRGRGVKIHETRRLREQDVIRNGLPRTRAPTAVVHAVLWARSDREAALIFVASVQQGLARVEDLAVAIALVRRHRRRQLLRDLLTDVTDGVEALGERDFAIACRRRGFPKPTLQGVRELPSGRRYYDVQWQEYNLEVEIDGVQHLDAVAAARDMLKQNAAALEGKTLLRIPSFAFRSDPEPFLDQIEAALRAKGWEPRLRQRKRAS